MNWNFSGITVYGQTFCFKVKANDKQSAIKKGIEKVKAKFFCNTNKWNITLA